MKLMLISFLAILVSIKIYKTEEIQNKNIFKNTKLYEVVKIDSVQHIYLIYLERNDSIFKVLSNKTLNKNCNEIKIGNKYSFVLKSWFKPEEIHLKYRMAGVKIEDAYVEIERNRNIVGDLFITKNLKGLCYLISE